MRTVNVDTYFSITCSKCYSVYTAKNQQSSKEEFMHICRTNGWNVEGTALCAGCYTLQQWEALQKLEQKKLGFVLPNGVVFEDAYKKIFPKGEPEKEPRIEEVAPDKVFTIKDGDISDGYHTFTELYRHRCLLFLLWLVEERAYKPKGRGREVFYQLDHYPDWDLVGTNVGPNQISYHVPKIYRPVLEKFFTEKKDLTETFDGHTSNDVADRLHERLFRYADASCPQTI